MKAFRHLLALVLAAAMVFGFLPMPAQAIIQPAYLPFGVPIGSIEEREPNDFPENAQEVEDNDTYYYGSLSPYDLTDFYCFTLEEGTNVFIAICCSDVTLSFSVLNAKADTVLATAEYGHYDDDGRAWLFVETWLPRGEYYILLTDSDNYLDQNYHFSVELTSSCDQHIYSYDRTVNPTCTEEGYDVYSCICSAISIINTTPATGHSWDEGTVIQEATESFTGIMEYACTSCGEVSREEIPVKEHIHDYTAEIRDPTCTSDGSTRYTCRCGDWYVSDEIPATGHDWELTLDQEPTETSNGLKEYTCLNCGEVRQQVVYHDHNYIDEITPPTCTEDGFTTKTCSCGSSYITDPVPATGHEYVWTCIDPTCTEDGYTTNTCHCGDTHTIRYPEATGHSWNSGVVITPPTGVSAGLRRLTCDTCGTTQDEVIPMTGKFLAFVNETDESDWSDSIEDIRDNYHVYARLDSWDTSDEFAFTLEQESEVHIDTISGASSLKMRVSRYGTVLAESNVIISSLDGIRHYLDVTLPAGDYILQVHDTEQRNYNYSFQLNINPLGSLDYLESEPNNRKDIANAIASGHTVSAYIFSAETEDYFSFELNVESSVSITSMAKDDSLAYSIRDSSGRSKLAIGAYDSLVEDDCHRYLLETTLPAGTYYLVFTGQQDCNYLFLTEFTPAQGHAHNYSTTVVTPPSCTEAGYTTYQCDCGDNYTADEVPAPGHDWDEGVVTREPTEEEEGEARRECMRCGEAEIRTLPRLEHIHNYTTEVSAPTCTVNGCTTHTCSCGESYISDEIAALGHAYEGGSCTRCGEADPDGQNPTGPAGNPFLDIQDGLWYFTPVLWAVDKGITSGTSQNTFSPDAVCTRAQVVTFLWRAVGSPEPKLRDNPFHDVAETAYFYKAVLWAVENGITSGTGLGQFGPDQPCTRAQVVTFLWRTMGKPAPLSQGTPFVDISSGIYYYEPVLWAVEKGITAGVSSTSFAPDNPCTRAQVVTFLYRTLTNQ